MFILALGGLLSMAYAAEPVAVLELFTSEGCSSCPPAERLLAEIAEEAEKNQQAILPLSFHVDYWDRLGWPDPYADAAHTQRQRVYAQTLASESIYTPQLVVNGQSHYVGSDRTSVRRAIASALKTPAAVSLHVSTPSVQARTVKSRVHLQGDLSGPLVLTAVITEAEARTAVQAGENRGRLLRHTHVVRAHDVVPVQGEIVAVELTLPEDFATDLAWREEGRLVVLAQRQSDLHVLGASAVRLK